MIEELNKIANPYLFILQLINQFKDRIDFI